MAFSKAGCKGIARSAQRGRLFVSGQATLHRHVRRINDCMVRKLQGGCKAIGYGTCPTAYPTAHPPLRVQLHARLLMPYSVPYCKCRTANAPLQIPHCVPHCMPDR